MNGSFTYRGATALLTILLAGSLTACFDSGSSSGSSSSNGGSGGSDSDVPETSGDFDSARSSFPDTHLDMVDGDNASGALALVDPAVTLDLTSSPYTQLAYIINILMAESNPDEDWLPPVGNHDESGVGLVNLQHPVDRMSNSGHVLDLIALVDRAHAEIDCVELGENHDAGSGNQADLDIVFQDCAVETTWDENSGDFVNPEPVTGAYRISVDIREDDVDTMRHSMILEWENTLIMEGGYVVEFSNDTNNPQLSPANHDDFDPTDEDYTFSMNADLISYEGVQDANSFWAIRDVRVGIDGDGDGFNIVLDRPSGSDGDAGRYYSRRFDGDGGYYKATTVSQFAIEDGDGVTLNAMQSDDRDNFNERYCYDVGQIEVIGGNSTSAGLLFGPVAEDYSQGTGGDALLAIENVGVERDFGDTDTCGMINDFVNVPVYRQPD
ncbi:hypothetical protein ACNSTU_15645 [Aquisalimonas sp. APHAB1-3]|uniref:hypothetical protein n=1 Tax=Aquisalimonas sp. APHAB1-3 TaxID=3402080 RepID=UPI003AAE9EC4